MSSAWNWTAETEKLLNINSSDPALFLIIKTQKTMILPSTLMREKEPETAIGRPVEIELGVLLAPEPELGTKLETELGTTRESSLGTEVRTPLESRLGTDLCREVGSSFEIKSDIQLRTRLGALSCIKTWNRGRKNARKKT